MRDNMAENYKITAELYEMLALLSPIGRIKLHAMVGKLLLDEKLDEMNGAKKIKIGGAKK